MSQNHDTKFIDQQLVNDYMDLLVENGKNQTKDKNKIKISS